MHKVCLAALVAALPAFAFAQEAPQAGQTDAGAGSEAGQQRPNVDRPGSVTMEGSGMMGMADDDSRGNSMMQGPAGGMMGIADDDDRPGQGMRQNGGGMMGEADDERPGNGQRPGGTETRPYRELMHSQSDERPGMGHPLQREYGDDGRGRTRGPRRGSEHGEREWHGHRGGDDGMGRHDLDSMRRMMMLRHGAGAPGEASISVRSGDRMLSIDCGDTSIAECVAGAQPLIDLLR